MYNTCMYICLYMHIFVFSPFFTFLEYYQRVGTLGIVVSDDSLASSVNVPFRTCLLFIYAFKNLLTCIHMYIFR